MTQVPPTRYSSAIITRAPWLAAMRAARTPPEPAPITNRSTSAVMRSARRAGLRRTGVWRRGERRRRWASQVVALLLHLGAEARQNLVRHLFRPRLGAGQALVDDGRLV